MAEKKIYVDHNFQAGAKIRLATTSTEPDPVNAGTIYFDGTNFKASEDGSDFDTVTTATNTQTLNNKSISGGEFS